VCHTSMPGYMPHSSILCKTKSEAEYLAIWDKQDILEQTFDIDRQRNGYTASGHIRRDGRLDLEPKEGYGGPNYAIIVEPVTEDVELSEEDKATLEETGYLTII